MMVFGPRFILSHNHDPKIIRKAPQSWLEVPFVIYFCMYILEMAHVQIRGGVADWYWTADFIPD